MFIFLTKNNNKHIFMYRNIILFGAARIILRLKMAVFKVIQKTIPNRDAVGEGGGNDYGNLKH